MQPPDQMRIRDALAAASHALETISDTPRLDAEILMAHALNVSREVLLVRHLADRVPVAFGALVSRRKQSEPIAYITGHRAFWTIDLAVGPGVLIPRPDSETLIEAAIAHFVATPPATILDLGTGSGALLLSALSHWPAAIGTGIDMSAAALAMARKNADNLAISDRVTLQSGNWGEGVKTRFDLILCNPPYVETGAVLSPDVRDYEPAEALFAGAEGLDDYRRIIPTLGALLAAGGCAVFEIGATQAQAVGAIADAAGLSWSLHRDLGGLDRCLRITGGRDHF
jgi:release factor glutamine methyltransferase